MTTLNHTIADAAVLIAEKYGFDYKTREALFDMLQEAAHKGGLVVREPLTGLPYRPVHKGMHDYLMDIVNSEDLNAWLQKNGVEYRLDDSERKHQLEADTERPQGGMNQEWQSRLESMAADLQKQGKKSQATKGKLARTLSKEIGIDAATIERRTRKTW